MHKARKYSHIAGGLILILLAAGSLAGYWLRPGSPTHVPDIAVSTIDGERISLQQLRGRPVLVNFWATSCASCLRELPHLVELYRQATATQLQVIAIAMPYDRPDHVVAVSKARQLPFPVALDTDGAAARSFGDVQRTPTFFLIAPDGRIVHHATGSLDRSALQPLLEALSPQLSDSSPTWRTAR